MNARHSTRLLRAAALLASASLLASCGGSDDDNSAADGDAAAASSVEGYLQVLPTWAEFSPPLDDVKPTPSATPPEKSSERIDTVDEDGVLKSQQYACTTREFNMTSTPEKIVMFSPDRELLWPGALIQGKSHHDGLGSLVGLPIRERTPIKVSIPSLANSDNYRIVETPDQAEVNQAIGAMVGNATTAQLTAPSSIQFNMSDYSSDRAFALSAGLSGKYMGFSGSASASVKTAANERTVMVHFTEKMFEVVVEPPQTPGGFFSKAFTPDKLQQQVALGRIGPTNLPVYVSNIVYGRMMAFTFTSTASETDIKAALSAAYKGWGASVSATAEASYKKILSEARISITSIGGSSAATVAMIASGNWKDYFGDGAAVVSPLSSAYPISYTFRNVGDGSIAKVSESTSYNVKECAPIGGSDFVLESFELNTTPSWVPQAASPSEPAPVSLQWRDAATPQSLFYGYLAAEHFNNSLTDPDWTYNVGYIGAPAHFRGDMSSYYRGELSFWYKPGEKLVNQSLGSTTHCWTVWYLFIPITRCTTLPAALPANVTLKASDKVYIYDELTTTDQLVLRGGGTDAAGNMLTLTYNPKADRRQMTQSWQKLVLTLSNHDGAGQPLCRETDPDFPRGCWLVEERLATEDEIQHVLGNIQHFRIRASYPVYLTQTCSVPEDTLPAGTVCPSYVDLGEPVPLGFVGGYFDEIKMTKPVR